jgi:outer membrane lipoprotein-sorting protein
MHDRKRRRRSTSSRAVIALILPILALIFFSTGCGSDGGSSEVEQLIAAAAEADKGVESYRMVLSMSFEGEGTQSVTAEELIIDVADGDIRLADTLYDPASGEGTLIQMVVRVGDRQWRMDPSGESWVEEQPNLDEEVLASYKPRISDVLANSTSSVVLGDEEVNGVTATHLRFELATENLSALLPDIPQSNLEGNTGGQMDVWLEAEDRYPVRYEVVFRDVVLQRGYERVDVSIVLDVTGINQPIVIPPPV